MVYAFWDPKEKDGKGGYVMDTRMELTLVLNSVRLQQTWRDVYREGTYTVMPRVPPCAWVRMHETAMSLPL